jgi:hypothetical protein
VKFERVGSISVSDLILETFWEVYNGNSLIGASLNTHTTSDTQSFRDEANFAILGDLNTEFTLHIDGAGL